MSLSVPAMFTVEPNKQTLGCIELYYHVFAIKKLYAMLNADLFASNLYASSPLESTTAQLYQKKYWHFESIASIKIQTVIVYRIVAVIIDKFIDD